MKSFRIYIGIACVLLVLYIVAQLNRPTPINWQATLYYKDKIPYGTYILHNQLHQLFPNAEVINTNKSIYNQFHGHDSLAGTYLVVAKNVRTTKDDYEELLKYIRKGNSVFMSAFEFDGTLADTLKLEFGFGLKEKENPVNFTNPLLKRSKDYTFKQSIGDNYFRDFDTAHAVVLVKNAIGKAIMLKFQYGKGALYLSANPIPFTNISLLDQQNADFSAKALSYLPVTSTVYWDEFQNGDIVVDRSPVRVLFSNPALTWAYYISLFALVIFVLYEMKRRQRIIPVITPLENSTLGFVTVVGQVYYERRDNSNIAQKKVAYLLEYIRQKYRLQTNKIDQEFTVTLASRADMDIEETRELVGIINYVLSQAPITDQELIKANHLIEQFYTRSR